MVTLKGRIEIPVLIGEYQKARLNRIRGQADLIYRNGEFYLAVVVDAPEPSKFAVTDVLGVDLGIVNLAVDSDGQTFSGSKVEAIRKRATGLRSILQSVDTKNAKRHLKKLGCWEARFKRDVNHCISKVIVAKAKDTVRAIALEDLTGIRKTVTVRKAQRNRSHSWSFRQLRSFIEYKAALAGVPVFLVNPRGTSHICPECSHNEKANRPNRDSFRCVQCGFSGHADHVAAVNIRLRVHVNKPMAVYREIKALVGIAMEYNCKPMTLVMGS
jgi:IS605 OrfB family transposase